MKRKQQLGPLQREWLWCLESGEFEQTTNALFRLNEESGVYANCCLGVACCVAEANGVKLKYEHIEVRLLAVNDCSVVLPPAVVEALCFRDDCGISESGKDSLCTLNDYGHSFADIAAIVRKNPADYFTGPA